MQELLQQAMPAAQAALLQFQSCVRTTLLLSHGYECQEKVSILYDCCMRAPVSPHSSIPATMFTGLSCQQKLSMSA